MMEPEVKFLLDELMEEERAKRLAELQQASHRRPPEKTLGFEPRIIRLKDAPMYCGMDKNRFNKEVRPYLIEIPIGSQGIGFDRLDLDAWLEQYKESHGRLGKAIEGGSSWGRKPHQDSSCAATHGTFRNKSARQEFEKAVERATSRKRRDT